jgi:heterodisulfide reductase subunit A-like polyferredoxin
LTLTEVQEISGEPGDFRVKVTQKPRFIDPAKCTGCGDCVAVCPVVCKNEFDLGLDERRAIYRRYAQAVPGAFTIEKHGTSPCKATCPAHISVQGYLALVAEGKYHEALKLIKQENPLPAICGRVCPHPCETTCMRGEVDEPVAIDAIKRFVADLDLNSETRYIPEIKEKRDEKVAIVGSGPAGLTCAYFLAIEGYQVTVFEKLPVLGGMLSVGIPSYRLPSDIIEAEIQVIRDMGVQLKTGIDIGKDITVGELREQGYQAFFVAIGAHECKVLGIEGEDLEGVYPGVDYLREVNLGNHVSLGNRVAVVGGGNVAMDAVRTALRLGSSKPFIVYRRSLEEMPASEEEIEECKEEGIEIHFLTNPTRVIGENGRVKAIECVKMRLGEPDESGRRRPEPIAGSEFLIEVDSVIPAIGQESDWACLTEECVCTLSDWNTMQVDPLTLQSNDPDIFAGGDAVHGPRTVIEAIAHGKQAAISIDRFIRGEDLIEGREKEWKAIEGVETEGYDRIPRERMPRLAAQERSGNFNEVQLGFTEEQVRGEAQRCLNCGVCSECYECVSACLAEAVIHDDQTVERELDVGAIIVAPGFKTFDPSRIDTYAYAQYPNVMTSIEFERLLSASGPTQGHLQRLSDEKEPKAIGFLQCVGSRDINLCDHSYCSSVCCTYAIKQAVVAKEHVHGDLDTAIFFMDMRTHGKEFERYYDRAREEHGVRFIRSRVHSVETDGENGNLVLEYVLEDGTLRSESFDMVVLSVGIEPSDSALELANKLGIRVNEHSFCEHSSFEPVSTSRPGVFVCGAFQSPKDIPQSVVEANAAVGAAGNLLEPVAVEPPEVLEVPEQLESAVFLDPPRIGVFVCNCGINIGGVVRVPEVVEYASNLPFVVHCQENLFSCSQDAQGKLKEVIQEQRLNRVVVAACSPRTHEPLFKDTVHAAGVNKYLFEMANIRDQDSWVHQNAPEAATQKAKDLVRMAVAKAALLEPLDEQQYPITPEALVVGGGVAGMQAALTIAESCYPVHLVERTDRLGGQANHIHWTWKGEDVQEFRMNLEKEVRQHPLITLHLGVEVTYMSGFVGNFRSTLTRVGTRQEAMTVDHGVVVLATGGAPYRPKEYLYGEHRRVFMWHELDDLVVRKHPIITEGGCGVFIQCVGSRNHERPYCSRMCCTHSLQTALRIKEINHDMDIYVLYRDLRTHGLREDLYAEARSRGVIFIRHSLEDLPKVDVCEDGKLEVRVLDHVLQRPIILQPDFINLATAVVPTPAGDLARHLKVPLNQDGFFLEAHAKLKPLDFATDGVFVCGLAHYPKDIEESVAQAMGAAARAVSVLAKKIWVSSGLVSHIDPATCVGCQGCLNTCPYDAIDYLEEQRICQVNIALCKGCGSCAAACTSGSARLAGFARQQINAQIVASMRGI